MIIQQTINLLSFFMSDKIITLKGTIPKQTWQNQQLFKARSFKMIILCNKQYHKLNLILNLRVHYKYQKQFYKDSFSIVNMKIIGINLIKFMMIGFKHIIVDMQNLLMVLKKSYLKNMISNHIIWYPRVVLPEFKCLKRYI